MLPLLLNDAEIKPGLRKLHSISHSVGKDRMELQILQEQCLAISSLALSSEATLTPFPALHILIAFSICK